MKEWVQKEHLARRSQFSGLILNLDLDLSLTLRVILVLMYSSVFLQTQGEKESHVTNVTKEAFLAVGLLVQFLIFKAAIT